MIPIVSFIGWQNAGKTTLIREIITQLKKRKLRVGVIKATHHEGIEFDRPGSDTDTYRAAGADSVTLLAPDQMITMTRRPERKLVDMVNRFFYDFDIVIGEGFKEEPHIAKIEVNRGGKELLRDQVSGIFAVVTDQQLTGDNIFKADQYKEITDCIIEKLINNTTQPSTLLYVNGKKIPMKGFVQDALAGTVNGFVQTLKRTDVVHDIDLKVRFKQQ